MAGGVGQLDEASAERGQPQVPAGVRSRRRPLGTVARPTLARWSGVGRRLAAAIVPCRGALGPPAVGCVVEAFALVACACWPLRRAVAARRAAVGRHVRSALSGRVLRYAFSFRVLSQRACSCVEPVEVLRRLMAAGVGLWRARLR